MKYTKQQKTVLQKALKFTEEVVTKMGKMTKRERDRFWRELSEEQKQALVITFLK